MSVLLTKARYDCTKSLLFSFSSHLMWAFVADSSLVFNITFHNQREEPLVLHVALTLYIDAYIYG